MRITSIRLFDWLIDWSNDPREGFDTDRGSRQFTWFTNRNQPINHPCNNQSDNQSTNKKATNLRSFAWSVDCLISSNRRTDDNKTTPCINDPLNQSINPTINQSINHQACIPSWWFGWLVVMASNIAICPIIGRRFVQISWINQSISRCAEAYLLWSWLYVLSHMTIRLIDWLIEFSPSSVLT